MCFQFQTCIIIIFFFQLPPIPEMYSSELYDIITSMLDEKPESRPCVTELLLNDYIRRYILLILQDDSKRLIGFNFSRLIYTLILCWF